MRIPKKTVRIGGELFEIPDLQKLFGRSIWGIVAIIVGIWLLSGFYIVSADQQGVVRLFGKFNRVASPGINWHAPWPFEAVDKPKVLQVKRAEIGFRTIDTSSPARYVERPQESVMLTGNLNIVSCDVIVQYRILDAYNYLFKVRDPEVTVHTAAEAAIRQVIGKHDIDEALTIGKGQIQDEAKTVLQNIIDNYDLGISIVAVQLQDVHPPKEVAEAFRDVASAREDQDKLINIAQGYNNDLIPRVRGEAAKTVKEAEAWASARIATAEGDADRFNNILTEYRKSRDVTRKRILLETMEEILPGVKKYIVKTDKAGGLINILNMPDAGKGVSR